MYYIRKIACFLLIYIAVFLECTRLPSNPESQITPVLPKLSLNDSLIYSKVLSVDCSFVTVIENSISSTISFPGMFLDSIISQNMIDDFNRINQDTVSWEKECDFNIEEEHVFIRQEYIDSVFQNRNTWEEMIAAWNEIYLRYNVCGILGVSRIAYNIDTTAALISIYHRFSRSDNRHGNIKHQSNVKVRFASGKQGC